MTTINPYYGTYLPPIPPPEEPPLPPPPVVIGADGRPREPEVIIVIGQRTDPYRHLMPYRGLTGGAENSRRDMEMAMAGPEDRARMLGMDPNAIDDLGRDESSSYDYEILAFSTDAEIDAKWALQDGATLELAQVPVVPPSFFFARPPYGPMPRHMWQPFETPGAPIPGIARGLPPRGVEPPVSGPFTRAPASRPSELSKGGESLFDPKGGEWRWAPGDMRHRPHWDYNPKTAPNSQWQNIMPSGSGTIITI
jgi:hypothetical protein